MGLPGLPDLLVCDPDTATSGRASAGRMLVVAPGAGPALEAALRVGAKDALAWPAEAAELIGAAEHVAAGRAIAGGGLIVAVAGVRSCGATALVANLGASMSRRGRDVVAVDCDLAHADLSGLMLDESCHPAAEEILSDGLDPVCVIRSVHGVKLVAARGGEICHGGAGWRLAVAAAPAVGPGGVVLADLPSGQIVPVEDGGPAGWSPEPAAVLLLVPLDFAGIRRADRVIEAWPEERPCPLSLVFIEQRRGGIAATEAADVLDAPVMGVLPNGGVALLDSLDQGKLLSIRPSTPYARAVEKLAASLEAALFPATRGGGRGRRRADSTGGRPKGSAPFPSGVASS